MVKQVVKYTNKVINMDQITEEKKGIEEAIIIERTNG